MAYESCPLVPCDPIQPSTQGWEGDSTQCLIFLLFLFILKNNVTFSQNCRSNLRPTI